MTFLYLGNLNAVPCLVSHQVFHDENRIGRIWYLLIVVRKWEGKSLLLFYLKYICVVASGLSACFVLFCVFIFVRAILSRCPLTKHDYIVYNIISLNIYSIYILLFNCNWPGGKAMHVRVCQQIWIYKLKRTQRTWNVLNIALR